MRGPYQRDLAITWLRDEPLAALVDALALEFAQEPYDWRRALRRHLDTPVLAQGMATISTLASDAGVSTFNPLIDPAFVAALSRAGGWRGYMNRTDVLTSLFSDLLPDEVLRRTSKATFGRSAFNAYSRAFVREWDGQGVDPTLVDVAALRATWQAETPHGMSYALLQSCWLATQPIGAPPTVV
jgi:asparagine synthase (glutamine-hydrolysing)